MNPIEIELSVPAQKVYDEVKSFAKASEEAIGQSFSRAGRDAEKALFRITEAQKVVQAQISEESRLLEQLTGKRAALGAATDAALDGEIDRLKSLIQLRANENLTLEAKRTALSRVAAEQAADDAANDEPPDPGSEEFVARSQQEELRLNRHPERLPWGGGENSNRAAKGLRYITNWGSAGGDMQKQVTAANVYGRKLIELARVQSDIDSGKLQATPEQQQALHDSMMQIAGQLKEDGLVPHSGNMRALIYGSYGNIKRDDVLNSLNNDKGQVDTNKVGDFLGNSISYSSVSDSIRLDTTAGPIFDKADAVERELKAGSPQAENAPVQPFDPRATPATPIQGPAAPTAKSAPQPASTQPSAGASPAGGGQPMGGTPVSVNYHIRQTVYGYSSDSIGAPASNETEFG